MTLLFQHIQLSYMIFYSFNEGDSVCVFYEEGYKAAYEGMISIKK